MDEDGQAVGLLDFATHEETHRVDQEELSYIYEVKASFDDDTTKNIKA